MKGGKVVVGRKKEKEKAEGSYGSRLAGLARRRSSSSVGVCREGLGDPRTWQERKTFHLEREKEAIGGERGGREGICCGSRTLKRALKRRYRLGGLFTRW